LSDGGPLVLCQGGFQGELVRYLASQAGHDHSAAAHVHGSADNANNASHEGPTHCPVGSTLHNVAFLGSHDSLAIYPATSGVLPPPVGPLSTTSVTRRQPIRAPPHILSS
jgi:hypothetical protein